jgi:flagellin
LSSGLRINRAGDDAAGLAVSEKMRAQVRGLNQASRNAQDGISLIQTAEGWLNETGDMLQRMRELAVQSANGTYTYEDRQQINQEIKQLVDEIDRIASHAEFNNLKLLRGGFRRDPIDENYTKGVGPRPWAYEEAKKDANPPVRPIGPSDPDVTPHTPVRANEVGEGDATAINAFPGSKGGVYFHIGSNMDHREQFYIENMSAYALGLAKGAYAHDAEKREMQLDYLSQDGSNRAIAQIDSAIYIVGRQRADLGAYQNRLEHTIKAVDYAAENLQATESRIRDVDMAKEMVDFVKNQILSQSSASMLAQANLRPQVVLRVLG